ncbi:unnamed protein product, partial [Musa acuminata var. zebrina]
PNAKNDLFRCCTGIKIEIMLGVREFVRSSNVHRKFCWNQPRSPGVCQRSSSELAKKIVVKSRSLSGVH